MYGNLEGFKAYHTARGNNEPTAAQAADATAALVRASDYIEIHYATRLADGYDNTLSQLVTAAYIAAAYELKKPGFFSKTYSEADRKVLTKLEGMQWTHTGNTNGIDAMVPRSTSIEALLTPFLRMSQVSGGLVV